MTCVVGAVVNGEAVIGSDSWAGDGYYGETIESPKIFRFIDPLGRPVLMGYTTSFRMGQLLEYELPDVLRLKESRRGDDVTRSRPPNGFPGAPGRWTDEREFVVRRVVAAARGVLSEGGFLKQKDGREIGGSFLVISGGRVFQVGEDFGVTESTHGFNAVGCGSYHAMGAMYAAKGRQIAETACDLVGTGLTAAEEFGQGVQAPFHFLSSTPTPK